MHKPLILDKDKLRKLRDYFAKLDGIRFAAIIGSIATKGCSYHDIDLAIKVQEGVRREDKYALLSKIIDDLVRILNVGLEDIDIVDLDRADIELKKRILESGIILLDRGFLKNLVDEVMQIYPEYYEYRTLSIKEWLSSQDPTDIDINVIKRRLDFIRSELEFLERYILSKSVEEVKQSPILRRLLERSYQLMVEAVIDICRHIVSAKGWGPAYRASEFITKCYENAVIGSDICNYFVNAIKIRNIVIHRYLEIDYEVLYEEAKKLAKYIRVFEKQIVEYLRSLGKQLNI